MRQDALRLLPMRTQSLALERGADYVRLVGSDVDFFGMVNGVFVSDVVWWFCDTPLMGRAGWARGLTICSD